MKKVFGMLLAVMLIVSMVPLSALAASEPVPEARMVDENAITFANLSSLAVNESIEFKVIDADGNPATVGIERVDSKMRVPGQDWKVWYTGVSINAHFYMSVSNNKVTSVYDEWILIIGGTYDDASLTKTTTQGKLSFKVEAYAGILAGTCWLKGTVTGSNDEITVDWQM